MRSFWYVLLVFLCVTAVFAQQDDLVEYRWEDADLLILYPFRWHIPQPIPSSNSSGYALLLSQFATNNQDHRTSSTAFVEVHRISGITPGVDLYGLLESALLQINIRPAGPLSGRFLERDAIRTNGTDREGSFFGWGRIAIDPVDNSAVMIVGRASIREGDEFLETFERIAANIVLGADRLITAPEYGLVWYTSSLASGDSVPFHDIRGLALYRDELFLLDAVSGLLVFDRASGSLLRHYEIATEFVMDLVLGTDGRVYLADAACQCVRIFVDGQEVEQITGFSQNSPQKLAIAPDGTLYVSNLVDGLPTIHVIRGGVDTPLIIEDSSETHPILARDRLGRLLALVDNRIVYVYVSGRFAPLFEVPPNIQVVTDLAIDSQNNIIMATEHQGILIFNSEGAEINRVGRIVAGYPLAGELVRPGAVVVDEQDQIYWGDSTGDFGAVTAVSLQISELYQQRVELDAGRADLYSTLSADAPIQQWLLELNAGDTLTVTMLAVDESLDPALRFFAIDGRLLAENEDALDSALGVNAQLVRISIVTTGAYRLESLSSSGSGDFVLQILVE